MATNMYVKFDKVEGESEDMNCKGWIEILSWSHSFSQPASPVRDHSGSTVEKANHSDLNITKYIDKSTDDLLKSCWSGKQYEKMDMKCYRSDGENAPILYLELNLEDVIISNYSISGGGGSVPVENLSLSYSKVTYKYNEKKKADAKAAGVQPVSHDLKTNKVA